MSQAPDLTSVIVTWNSGEHIGDCVRALRQSARRSHATLEIVVVDNASQDDSAVIANDAGADRIVQNPINAGFAVAASQGIALASGSWILMTNPDLVVDEPFVQAVADAVGTAAEEMCCLAPDIRFATDSSVVNSNGIAVDRTGIPSEIGKGRKASVTGTPTDIFGASGGGSILRRSALDEVGGFEPAYFAYYEDVDLAWRLQRSGYRARFLADATASHAGSSTVGVGSPLQTYLVARNRRLMFYRHGPHDARARAWRAFSEAGHAVFSCLMTRSAAPLRGRAAALSLRLYMRYLRRLDRAQLARSPDILISRVSSWSALSRKLSSIALEKRNG
jgi:GT2 family glycosyltransferase